MTDEVRPTTAVSGRSPLLRRGLRLEYATIAWNSLEGAATIAAGPGGRVGGAHRVRAGLRDRGVPASVVLWHLRATPSESRERLALRLIALTFIALSGYLVAESTYNLAVRARPSESVAGIVITALSLIVMPLLALAKRRMGRLLASQTLMADAAETLFCAWLSAVTLEGLIPNAALGLWWADPVAALVIAGFALREAAEAWPGHEPAQAT